MNRWNFNKVTLWMKRKTIMMAVRENVGCVSIRSLLDGQIFGQLCRNDGLLVELGQFEDSVDRDQVSFLRSIPKIHFQFANRDRLLMQDACKFKNDQIVKSSAKKSFELKFSESPMHISVLFCSIS